LLAPEPVPLTAAELAAAIEAADTLAQLGVRVEAFGGDTLLVRSLPAMLGSVDPAELARELVARLMDCGPTPQRRDLLDHLLHTLACKAAIKAGDPLAPDEVEALLAQRHLAQDAHHCPHGRPTALVFTRQELDRQFKRT
jgi:DNA mismatch repair protein MutL